MSAEKSGTVTGFSTSDKLAFERTLMAWVRTATALIAFGFGMYKLFEFVPFVSALRPGEHVISPRAFALVLAFLALVGIGVLLMVLLRL